MRQVVKMGFVKEERCSPVLARRLRREADLRMPAWLVPLTTSRFLARGLLASSASLACLSVEDCEQFPMFVRLFDFWIEAPTLASRHPKVALVLFCCARAATWGPSLGGRFVTTCV